MIERLGALVIDNVTALDIDLASDLADFARMPGSTHTLNELARMGMAQL